MIEVGEKFPVFKKKAWSGEEINLQELEGMIVVVYFYPKDMTSGCTTEANEFTKLYDQFTDVNAEVVGISVDDAKSHEKFATKNDIAIPLVTDEKGALATKLGILKKTGMAERTTFVLDRDGVVAKVYEKVKADGHAARVLEFVKSL